MPALPGAPQSSYWTGLVDPEKQNLSRPDSWWSEETEADKGGYVTLQLRPGDTSLDWSGSLDGPRDVKGQGSGRGGQDSPGGSAREEVEEDDTDGELQWRTVTQRPPPGRTLTQSPTGESLTTERKGKDALNKIVNSFWKPWNYFTGAEEESEPQEGPGAPHTTTVSQTQRTADPTSSPVSGLCL